MRVKLTELYNTKYFYVTTGKDLTYMLSTCLQLMQDPNIQYNIGNEKLGVVYNCFKTGADIEFDLAGTHITSDVTPTILSFSERGIKFVDTENKWRDEILAENRRRFEQRASIQNEVLLPPLPMEQPAVEYVQELSKDVIYRVPPQNQEITLPLVVLICIYRPSIQLHLDDVALPLMRYVAKNLTLNDLSNYDEFYMATPEGISVVKAGQDIYVQQLGYVDMEKASTVADFVPTEFGRVRLNEDAVFRTIATSCVRVLNRYRESRPVKLSEIL